MQKCTRRNLHELQFQRNNDATMLVKSYLKYDVLFFFTCLKKLRMLSFEMGYRYPNMILSPHKGLEHNLLYLQNVASQSSS